MKILLAINATDYKHLGDRALRWCGRLGYQLRVFVPKNKRSKFMQCIDDVNYHYYLNLQYDILVGRTTAMEYAKQHDFDLLLTVPEDLTEWRKGTAFKDTELIPPVKTIGAARIEFGKKPGMKIKRFSNGAVMERVIS